MASSLRLALPNCTIGFVSKSFRTGDNFCPCSLAKISAKSFWTKVLPNMTRLKSFSVAFHDFPIVDVKWSRSKETCCLLESLPESCTAIEIDTAGTDGWIKPTHHICQTIQKILPRMKHVRSSLSGLCKCIPLKDQRQGPSIASRHPAEYTVAPLLETLVIFLRRLVLCQNLHPISTKPYHQPCLQSSMP